MLVPTPDEDDMLTPAVAVHRQTLLSDDDDVSKQ